MPGRGVYEDCAGICAGNPWFAGTGIREAGWWRQAWRSIRANKERKNIVSRAAQWFIFVAKYYKVLTLN